MKNNKTLTQLFVDSLKEWCDRDFGAHELTAFQLLEFAVQRLELIKQGE